MTANLITASLQLKLLVDSIKNLKDTLFIFHDKYIKGTIEDEAKTSVRPQRSKRKYHIKFVILNQFEGHQKRGGNFHERLNGIEAFRM